MRILILTSSTGTAHNAAAEALAEWIIRRDAGAIVKVVAVLENASYGWRCAVGLYNWIQCHAPWLHKLYWRLCELEDCLKLGTLLFGRSYVLALLEEWRPSVVVSTSSHANRGHFPFIKRVMRRRGQIVRCVTCCTELDGGFGFTRNWVSGAVDLFWAQTGDVAEEARKRGVSSENVVTLGPLLFPEYHAASPAPIELVGCPKLVLAAGGNGANNHLSLLYELLPFAGLLQVIVLCGKRDAIREQIDAWAQCQPAFDVKPLGFLGPAAMVELYRTAWVFVARPGARTAAEALALGCPLIFNVIGGTMPQERLARRYFRKRQLETVIRRPRDLPLVVQRWLTEPPTYQRLRERMREERLQGNPWALLEAVLQD